MEKYKYLVDHTFHVSWPACLSVINVYKKANINRINRKFAHEHGTYPEQKEVRH
jgi:hypothetical protein